MSWQSYVDNMIASSQGSIGGGAIVGLDGIVWGSKDLSISAEEGRKLVAGFAKPSVFLSEGIVVGGKSYLYIRNTDRSVVGKLGEPGVFATRGNKCLIVATFNGAPQLASVIVEPLADYLIQVGF